MLMLPHVKKYFWVILIVLVFIPAKFSFAVDDTIIAVVNDDVITLKNLSDSMRSAYIQLRSEGKSEKEIDAILANLENRGLEKLIEDRLIIQEAKKKQLEIRPKVVDDKMDELRKRYPSEKDFINDLSSDGMTISDLKTKITEQFMIQYLVDLEVRSKIFVNPQEVTEYYAAHKEDFKRPDRVNLDSIFIKFKGNVEESRKKAQEAYNKLTAGADFREIAKAYSDTPAIGTIKKGDFLSKLDEAIFKLNVGEMSATLETDTGIFIFKLLGKIPEEIPEIDTVKKDITNLIFQEKFKERLNDWLTKLKKNAYVEIKG